MSLFDNTYELPLARGYVNHWGLPEAIRELIQNAIDSSSPFQYSIDKEDDGRMSLYLTSEFTVLTPQTLLLGSTSKRDDADSIGSFGEGYKIALLVLTRLGYPVVMHNGSVDWRPTFRHSKRFGDDILQIDETKATDKTQKGLTVCVSGLTQDDLQAVIDSCLMMQSHIGSKIVTPLGDILLERPGMLYVGGLFICKTDFKFGYNVLPKHIRLERDRKTVDGLDLKALTTRIWYETKDFDRVAKMIEEDIPDLYWAKYDAPEMVREACYQLFRKNHPGAVVAQSQEELKQLVAQGMERVIVVGGGTYHAVSRSVSYRTEKPVRLVPPHDRLQAWYDQYKFNMHVSAKPSFEALIKESKGWQRK